MMSSRSPLVFLAMALAILAVASPARAQSSFTPAQQQEIQNLVHDEMQKNLDAAVHDYLVAHPEAVVDALNAAQKNEADKAAATASQVIRDNQAALFDSADDLVAGDPKGTATIVEFFDYRCPYCKAMQPTLDALLKSDPKLRVVYKEFPILGEPSLYAARVAIAAKKQGKYAQFHQAMMATKGEAEITDKVVSRVAASVGLDLKKMQPDINGPDVKRIIDANAQIAQQIGINGTPGLIVGDTLIAGAADIDTMRERIAAVRKGS